MATKVRGLIQAGHVAPRERGFESGTGTVREQEFALLVRGALAAKFQADPRFTVALAPGDLPDGWVGDFALYLHGDGAASKLAHGYSFGYQNAAGERLASRIAARFAALGHPGGHHADNYTVDLHFYYGFRKTLATVEVLVEHGFLTNPAEQAWMFQHAGALAQAEYEAVLEDFGFGVGNVLDGRPSWGDYLQLWVTPPGGVTRKFIGWEQAWPAVGWVAANGLREGARASIAWMAPGPDRRIERDPRTVVNVCRSLVARHRKGTIK